MTPQDVVCPIIDAGLDYVTMTEPLDSEKGKALHACTVDWLVGSCEGGAGLKPQSPQGFVGAGNEFGFMGVREGLLMARVAGRNTTDYWAKLMEYGQDFHCTRIDTQVTCEWPGNNDYFASRIRALVKHHQFSQARKKRTKATLYESDTRDTGIALLDRTGETYIRAYHPLSAGHLEYGNSAIRFEVEWKGNRAGKVFALAAKSLGVQYVAASLVQGEMWARGVTEPKWGSQSIPRPTKDYSPTDNAKRFKWFERSVLPALAHLMQDDKYRGKIHQLYTAAHHEALGKRRSSALEMLRGEAAYFKAKEYEIP